MTQSLVQIFVYGTLKPGYQPYERFCAKTVRQVHPAIVAGQLYHLPLGYPALIAGDQWVQGYLLAFADEGILTELDDYEQHDPEVVQAICGNVLIADVSYQRLSIPVFTPQNHPLGMAWAYMMTQQQVQILQGERVRSGNWQG
jgi:gamma-glutamylcyclotransferase (GGCT)/AIG2-like uncharacterized protein YtfP